MDLKEIRASFAEELRYVAHVRSDRLISTFATVPREHFLGTPPWQICDLQDGSTGMFPAKTQLACITTSSLPSTRPAA